MLYLIMNSFTNKPLMNTDGIIYFRNETAAKRYLTSSLKNSSSYYLEPATDKIIELKHEQKITENQIYNLYHKIELANENNDEQLLNLAKELRATLKQRRKIKNKLKGAQNTKKPIEYQYK